MLPTPIRSVIRGILPAAILMVLPSQARAQYLDPGSGSILIQALIAGAVAVATVVKVYWHRILVLFGRRPKSDA